MPASCQLFSSPNCENANLLRPYTVSHQISTTGRKIRNAAR